MIYLMLVVILISIASKHWQNCNNKKETYFREWLKSVNAEITTIEEGEFKESGTLIGMNIINYLNNMNIHRIKINGVSEIDRCFRH